MDYYVLRSHFALCNHPWCCRWCNAKAQSHENSTVISKEAAQDPEDHIPRQRPRAVEAM
jgi:hypothetical protein